MSRLVFFPSESIQSYLDKGRDYDFLDHYYNPGCFFDEVVCLSPWGEKPDQTISKIRYIKSSPYRFKRIIKRLNPDVVRGYGGYCCADWISFNKVAGIPTLVSVHDTNPELIHSSLEYADGIIYMSNAVKKAVETKIRKIPSKNWVMPNRIDTEVYSRKMDQVKFDELNMRFPGRYHILHVGRKEEQKNLDTVIKAMKYLEDDVTAVFLGRGDTEKYKKIANDIGVLERCFFVDSVVSRELPYWYSWCDCMCTPSRWEGFGYVFIEAAATETAIVTSNIGPMNEYLTNKKNAMLVDDYENPISIANAIKLCILNSRDIKLMKKNARDVGLRFSKEMIDQQEIEIYKSLISVHANNRNNYRLKYQLKKRENIERIKRGIKTIY